MPITYYLAVILCSAMLLFGVALSKRESRMPYGAALATIAAWYVVEPIYTPEQFSAFMHEDVSDAYLAVIIFLVGFAIFTPVMLKALTPGRVVAHPQLTDIKAEEILKWVIVGWILLLAFGTFRLNGDLAQALFPIESRAGVQMWSRAAGDSAGSSGFLVSTAAYLYVLCIAAFGVLIFMVEGTWLRIILMALIAISWPYPFLVGARSTFLSVCMPAVLSYLLFTKHPLLIKAVVVLCAGLVINLLLLIIIRYRDSGFETMGFDEAKSAVHYGLNMGSELTYAVSFLRTGKIEVDYGLRYLTEALNLVPRALWPEKPLLGIDYAIARGFADASAQDIGVVATVSTGVIGQGVLAFGIFFGPLFAALLFSIWVAALTRFRRQGTPIRLGLFLIGLGLTFNLGRDLTLLVLWPMMFAYGAAKIFERSHRHGATRRRHATAKVRGVASGISRRTRV